jgi:redox-sensitive bicupin YhaK (pirin superfamily)
MPAESVPGRVLEITPSRVAEVGGVQVRRALPRRTRRTVGAWCFADHMGPLSANSAGLGPGASPDDPDSSVGVQVGPHPHMGLQTVTWLVAGELLHRDSLGSEQEIRAGQLNLMTAGQGVSHAEESTGRRQGEMHGIQLWVAQPEATRHSAPAFEHHAQLPQVEFDAATATVLVGDFAGAGSPARRDTNHAGVELDMRRGRTVVPLVAGYEYAIVVLEGSVELGADQRVVPGELAYLGTGRDELAATTTEAARLLLLGGEPFESPILMWWNFVARTRAEMDAARADWEGGADSADSTGRFGDTGSLLARIPAPPTPWSSGSSSA